ncbi:MAG: hypothetical protein WC725_03075 [Patescibacteria group bacterium]|jgi:hypothetical protein
MNLRNKNITGLIIGLFLVVFGAAVYLQPVSAQSLLTGSADPLGVGYPRTAGFADTDVRITTAKTIRLALSMVGIIFLVIMLYGGYEWMTSAGNDEKVSQAKRRIYTGVIGLAVILVSYSITYFVITNLVNATY